MKDTPVLLPPRGTNMQRVTEFVFYELASKIHPLTEAQDDIKFSQIWSSWWDARAALEDIYRQLGAPGSRPAFGR